MAISKSSLETAKGIFLEIKKMIDRQPIWSAEGEHMKHVFQQE